MAQNEPRIVSDLKLRDDNDDEDIEGVVHQEALEDRDYFTQTNMFWVPDDARWKSLRHQAKQPVLYN